MFTAEPRVLVPRTARAGEIVPIKVLIGHRMETGLRRDEAGRVIPRQLVNRFVCRYGGAEVFSADLHESVAANPYLAFDIEATESGLVEFVWEEDGGASARLAHRLVVEPR